MKIDYQKHIDFLKNRIDALKKKVTNEITEDARAEIEGRIEQLRGIITDLEAIRDAAAEGTEDRSEEMRAQMREILARLDSIEDNKKEEKMESRKKFNSTKECMNAFMGVVQNSLNKEEFRKHLNEMAVKNSITITGSDISELLPAAILNEVNDIFVGHRHRLLEVVDWTGLPVFKSLYETGNDMANTWPSPMLGQTASETAKTEQSLTFTPIEIRPQFVYKTISIDKEIIKASEADGSVFIRYIVRELLDRLLCTIENYILTGNSNSFIAPAATTVVVDANSVPQYHAMNYLPHSTGLVAIVDPTFYIQTKQSMQSTYGYYVSDEFMARDFFGVDEVIMTPPGFSTTGDQVGVFFMNPRAYKMVGDRRPDEYEDFNLSWNRVQYLMEMWVGGGSVTPEFISLETE